MVYSKAKGINYLAEYARRYKTVEIDQWFWSLFGEDTVVLPKEKTVAEYAASVPEGFRFSIKVPNSITLTHFYKKPGETALKPNPHFLSVSLLEEFLQKIEPLRSFLGPLMLQFEYLNRKKMDSCCAFLTRLDEFFKHAPDNYLYALEPRNPQYLNSAYFDFLNQKSLSHVFIQGYYMPDITGIYKRFGESILRSTVIRLHGSDRQKMEVTTGKKWERIVEPRDEELGRIVEMIDDLIGRGVGVTLNVNNHYEGSAPITIERIKSLLV